MGRHIDDFEQWLKTRQIPYVHVGEAKRALNGAGRLRSFHFVVYGEGGDTAPNLLVFVTESPTRELRDDMMKWEEIFGKGFTAAFARTRDGRPIFQKPNGETFTWTGHPFDELAEIITKVKASGDDIELIEYLSDNDQLYADVEDRMAEAADFGNTAEENRLSDWLVEYRKVLIDGRPVPPAPAIATPPMVTPPSPDPSERPLSAEQMLLFCVS